MLFKTLKTVHSSARNRRATHVGIQLQVSDYEKFKLDTFHWTPT